MNIFPLKESAKQLFAADPTQPYGQYHVYDGNVSTDDISIPFPWLAGSLFTSFVLFFTVVWWIRGIKEKVDTNAVTIETMATRCLQDQEKKDAMFNKAQDERRLQFQSDINQSANEVRHGFELLAVEIRSDIRRLQEKIEDRNKDITELGNLTYQQEKRVDTLTKELTSLVSQLNSKNIDVHFRR